MRYADHSAEVRFGEVAASLADAEPAVLWTDSESAPTPRPALRSDTVTDLLVVGGGFTGLWAAIQAKQRDPGREVLLVEARRLAVGASGRNGGFCVASLTHGLDHGAATWPDEIARLAVLGRENLDAIEATVRDFGIDPDFQRSGQILAAVRANQVDGVRESFELHRQMGEDVEWLDEAAIRDEVDSPTYLGGYVDRSGCAMLDPARMAWGLADLAQRLGVRIAEHTQVRQLSDIGERVSVTVTTTTGTHVVTARDVILGTNAYPSPLRRLAHFVIPVYDHVLATEPLSASQLASVRWAGRQGVGDAGHQFHYYRLSADNRIVWGGYDANYHRGGAVDVALEQRSASHELLAAHFFQTFPQLSGVRFTHKWGGAIDTTSRFTPVFGTAHRGRVAYAVGYTGLGVGSSRWAAQVTLDLLAGEPTELTEFAMVRQMPVPFPPEPLRYPVVSLTRREIARSDDTGSRGPWLSLLDRFGIGFDS